MKINQSVVLITSAGTHLGGTLAAHFARMGATLILTDSNSNKLASITELCLGYTSSVHTYPMEDFSQKSVDLLFQDIDTRLNLVVDVLINNWIHRPLPHLIGNHSAEEFTQRLADITTNLFCFGHACAEQMRKHNNTGVIVNLLSNPDASASDTFENTSSIVSGLTKSWAKELDPFHIRVGGVIPAISGFSDQFDSPNLNMSLQCDELTRNAEYIVANDYFSGRVIAS